ncbi:response regulator receiver protein [Niabella ginsenosidivorans]|uniref:Response regulator receiver protein n=1 Tax=Niabella ginsenosidivorans TaxID=1176587 RepID=A0A1A9IA66_9BACT|nr:response regulator receiver protein [Niabella ginsenosidivorans]
MIIDDEDDMYFLLRNILRQRKIEALWAGSISDALDTLQREPDIFLIFLDNRLPDGLGYQHIQQFKAISPASIVMITAYDTSYDRKMAKDYGADDFIGKPFTKDSILTIVDRIISSRAL